MRTELIQKWGEPLLDFALDLPKTTSNFSKYVLRLLSQHFGFHKLLIFPYVYAAIDLENRSHREALSNYVTLNIDASCIREYEENIHKIDIFNPKILPAALRHRKVLFTQDVMQPEKYMQTEYYAHMSRLGMEKQACIYLKLKNEVIATICIFRSATEPDFTAQERELMEYLSDLISIQYITSLKMSGDALSQEGFNLFFRNAKVGAILLNFRLSVLMANNAAQDYSKLFMEVFKKKQNNFIRSSSRRAFQFASIQSMIDWIGLDLINEFEDSIFTSLSDKFRFYCWPIIFVNAFGDVETRHLILMQDIKKEISDDLAELYETLTQREEEILKLVARGYGNEEIAEILHVSIFTVRTHISNIYRKFEVTSRVELLMKINRGSELSNTEPK